MDEPRAKVYLVGAGPGAVDLITVRGAEVMRRAEVVVYDNLVNPGLLQLAPPGAELIYAGKQRGGVGAEQGEINRILIERAQSGKTVVRLKGGDPFIFGRGGEEAQALAAAGIGFEVVPGVTSAIAAPAFAGIPLTHREHGSFVAFITGHEDAGKEADAAVPWNELAAAARRRGTLVLLMGTARLGENLARLKAGGLAPETPAAAIQWGTTAAQQTVTGTLATLAQQAARAGIGSPAVVVIGECADLRTELAWFEQLPLFGRRIVVTRAPGKAPALAEKLRGLGAEVVEFPTIETVTPLSYAALDSAIARLGEFNWVIFTSPNGVKALVKRVAETGHDIRALGSASIGAIGPATAGALAAYGLKVAAMPNEYRAEAIIGALGAARIAGARFLIPRAEVAREVLPRMLLEAGAREVVIAPAYRTVRPQRAQSERIRELCRAGAIDLVSFTSSSTVNNFCELLGEPVGDLKAAAIGPVTAATAQERGFEVVVCPAEYTIEALADAIANYLRPRS